MNGTKVVQPHVAVHTKCGSCTTSNGMLSMYLVSYTPTSSISDLLGYAMHDSGMIVFIKNLSPSIFLPEVDGLMDEHLDVPLM
jgi:hypothetical protein